MFLNELRKGFAIPKAFHSEFIRIFSDGRFYFGELAFGESVGTFGPLSIDQACKILIFKPVDPVSDWLQCIAQDLSGLPATQSLGDQKHGVESVIVTVLLGTVDFVVDSHNHAHGIGDGERFHGVTMLYLHQMRN